MDSLINNLIVGVVIGIFLIYIGNRFSKDINDNILYGLFWLVYIITILVISNGILNFYFVKEINKKKDLKVIKDLMVLMVMKVQKQIVIQIVK